jgi:hypothetical protein
VPASLRWADGRSVYERHGGVKYATRVQLSGEERLIKQAGAGGGPAMAAEQAARSLGGSVGELTAALHERPDAEPKTAACGLRMDKAAAAFHVLTSGRRVEVIVGPAGSGKTRVLAEIGKAWSRGRVVGVTPSQSSRDVLAAVGVAECYNFARFLGHLEDRRGGLGPVRLGAQHAQAPLVHDLDRGHTRGGLYPPHEHAHPARLATPPALLVTTAEPIRRRTHRSATSAFTR